MFGCTAYVLRQPRGTKLEPRAWEGVYLETLDHNVYRILIKENSEIFRIVESRNVSFDESKFLGAEGLQEIMEEEDTDKESDAWESSSEPSSIIQSNTSEDDSYASESSYGYTYCSSLSVPQLPFKSFCDAEEEVDQRDENICSDIVHSSINNESKNHEFAEADSDNESDIILSENAHQPKDGSVFKNDHRTKRYPNRVRREPPKWYMASSVHDHTEFDVTTSDDPSLSEAINASREEKEIWINAIEDEFRSLEENKTWVEDNSPLSQPLPTHVVLKIKRQKDGNVDRFKARTVAGGNYQVYGENYLKIYVLKRSAGR